jgi:hypothetical protein
MPIPDQKWRLAFATMCGNHPAMIPSLPQRVYGPLSWRIMHAIGPILQMRKRAVAAACAICALLGVVTAYLYQPLYYSRVLLEVHSNERPLICDLFGQRTARDNAQRKLAEKELSNMGHHDIFAIRPGDRLDGWLYQRPPSLKPQDPPAASATPAGGR